MGRISKSAKGIGGDSHCARRLGCESVSQPARWPCYFPIGCSPAGVSFCPNVDHSLTVQAVTRIVILQGGLAATVPPAIWMRQRGM